MIFNLENETISYENKNILDSISLSINQGEKVALLGSSGSGKSTLLKRLYQLKSEEVSYLPQDLGLINNLSVYHNVYTSRLEKKSTLYNLINLIKPFKSNILEIEEILEKLEAKEKLMIKLANLSGGQKQRVAIAKSIYSNKSILLADEPISALDEYICKKSLNLINNSFETIICAIHNVNLALSFFDRVIGIKNGKIILDKDVKSITKEDTNRLYYATKK